MAFPHPHDDAIHNISQSRVAMPIGQTLEISERNGGDGKTRSELNFELRGHAMIFGILAQSNQSGHLWIGSPNIEFRHGLLAIVAGWT